MVMSRWLKAGTVVYRYTYINRPRGVGVRGVDGLWHCGEFVDYSYTLIIALIDWAKRGISEGLLEPLKHAYR